MIQIKKLEAFEDFKAIKEGDILACEWHRDVYEGPKGIRKRFGVYTVYLNKHFHSEIILHKKDNTYFNYAMFVDPNECSNLKSCVLISQQN